LSELGIFLQYNAVQSRTLHLKNAIVWTMI